MVVAFAQAHRSSFVMSVHPIIIGIMLWFRWFMIQNEPPTRMTTMRTANRNAIRFQRCPEDPFTCKKKTRCTTICTIAVAATPANTADAGAAPLMTIQNGTAVRTSARISPEE